MHAYIRANYNKQLVLQNIFDVKRIELVGSLHHIFQFMLIL